MLCYYDNKGLKGKCGYDICSERYLQYHEAEVFGSGFRRSDKRGYEKEILNSLEKIAKDIEKDLNDAIYANDYIKTKNAVNIKEALNDLRKCKISAAGNLDDKIMSLDWYVGGDKDKIREIQQGLNGFFETKRLLEDGVYGVKTKDALNDFVEYAKYDIIDFFQNAKAIEAMITLSDNQDACNSSYIKEAISIITTNIVRSRDYLAYSIWCVGVKFLEAIHLNISAKCLENSINSALPLNFSENGNDSYGIITAVKNSSELKKFIPDFLKEEMKDGLQSYYKTSMEFNKTEDLRLSLGKVDLEINIDKNENNFLILSCTGSDTYDFTEIRTFCLDETDLKLRFNLNTGSIANDCGVISQIYGIIKPYKITFNFQIKVGYNNESYYMAN